MGACYGWNERCEQVSWEFNERWDVGIVKVGKSVRSSQCGYVYASWWHSPSSETRRWFFLSKQTILWPVDVDVYAYEVRDTVEDVVDGEKGPNLGYLPDSDANQKLVELYKYPLHTISLLSPLHSSFIHHVNLIQHSYIHNEIQLRLSSHEGLFPIIIQKKYTIFIGRVQNSFVKLASTFLTRTNPLFHCMPYSLAISSCLISCDREV